MANKGKAHYCLFAFGAFAIGTLAGCGPKIDANAFASLEEAADLIAISANKYDASVTAELMLTDNGYTGEETPTKGRVFSLLASAFEPTMPEQKGQRSYGASNGEALSGTERYQSAYDFIYNHGLYGFSGEKDPSFNGESLMFKGETERYLDRFHAYYGASEKDDFFSTVNHDYLYENEERSQWTIDKEDYVQEIVSKKKIGEWVDATIASAPEGDKKSNLERFVLSWEDIEERASGNLAGLVADLNRISETDSTEELLALCQTLTDEQGYCPLFASGSFTSLSIQQKSTPVFLIKGVDCKGYGATALAANPERLASFYERNNVLFENAGFASPQEQSENLLGFLNATVVAYTATEDGAAGNLYAMSDKDESLGPLGFRLNSFIQDTSLADSYVYLDNYDWLKASLIAAADPQLFFGLKAFVIHNQMSEYLPCWNLPMLNTRDYGFEDYPLDDVSWRSSCEFPYLADTLASYYSSTSGFSLDASLCDTFLMSLKNAFKTRIRGESWLSAADKDKCCLKLDSMKHLSYLRLGNQSNIHLSEITYTDSLYLNCKAVKKAKYDYFLSLGKSSYTFQTFVESSINPLVANAFNLPSFNGIVITLGYLASHDRINEMSDEELLATYGWVIGHEMTHGFDSTGTKYDENGTYNPLWWTKEDYAKYYSLCDNAVAYYRDYESLPGQMTSPEKTLGENIADLGGIRLSLDIAASKPSFDYEDFWRQAAMHFATTATSAFFASTLIDDSHSYGRARVNKAFSSFENFHDTFKTEPGDFMYVPPEARISIW